MQVPRGPTIAKHPIAPAGDRPRNKPHIGSKFENTQQDLKDTLHPEAHIIGGTAWRMWLQYALVI